ncbi:hypothetical protein B0T25DRAFT_573930 [Lasiosphaeria hispida]|uniref:Uncharacterized protein n=1 Tax=Lasiosphaeria hispida TaxID=260671 RepID=A0AAJ0H6N9_9PEZI|nr:hypothetical protein B0T25DRAFT_573930 [Lasiosphaeria hispida]
MSSDTSADLLGQYTDFLTSNPSRSDRKILKVTLYFIKREQLELDRQTLSGFLDSDPPRESSKGILPLDELTERLELIAKIEDRIRDLRTHLTNTWNLRKGVAAFRTTARPVATGDILDVVVAAEDAFKMKRAFDLQWALIRIAALTGAADVDDDVINIDDSGPPEEGLIEESIDIRSWLDGIVPSNGDDDNDDDDDDNGVHDDDDDDDDDDDGVHDNTS